MHSDPSGRRPVQSSEIGCLAAGAGLVVGLVVGWLSTYFGLSAVGSDLGSLNLPSPFGDVLIGVALGLYGLVAWGLVRFFPPLGWGSLIGTEFTILGFWFIASMMSESGVPLMVLLVPLACAPLGFVVGNRLWRRPRLPPLSPSLGSDH